MTPNDLLKHWQTYNTLHQAPCETAAYLAAECHYGGMFPPISRAFGGPHPPLTLPQTLQYSNSLRGIITQALPIRAPLIHVNAIAYIIH